jgi:DNA-3-methyladenine glycosylase
MPPRLTRKFYRRDPVVLARALLGQRLVRVLDRPQGVRLAGTIVEVEAYLGVKDKAAHTCNGRRTPRNESMWGDGGHGYVYFTYGMHHCMNVVASAVGDPVAVLIRALEPTEGLERMYKNRKAARRDTDLCSGPAKLCQALDIDRRLDGHDLVTCTGLYIERARETALPTSRIAVGPRIGVSYADKWADKPLRFYITDNPHVSKPRPPEVPARR